MSIFDEIMYHECDLSPLTRLLKGKYRVVINAKGARGTMYTVRDRIRRHLKSLETIDKTYMLRTWEYAAFGKSYTEYHIEFTIWLNCLTRKDYLELINSIIGIIKIGYKNFDNDLSSTGVPDFFSIRDMDVEDSERYFLSAPFTEENINEFVSYYF